jgi:hypothetical protein
MTLPFSTKRLKLSASAQTIFITLGLLCLLTVQGFAATNDTESATDSAERFLQQLDRGAYDQAWEESSGLFKRQTNKNMWRDNIGHLRPNYGSVQTRSLQFIKPLGKITGAPEGRYLLLIFGSSFSTRGQAAETVTLTEETDGEWRVLGYSIE